jgi:hypothetical protein
MNPNRSLLLLPLLALVTGCEAKPSADGAASAKPTAESAATSTTVATAAAPRKKGAVVDFCLGADGNSQDCGIACKVTKDEACCAKWAELTKKVCAKITKAECQSICEKDENPVACDIAKTMK